MAQPIKVRLAMANGMNSRLCHLAKEEIIRLEKLLLLCRQAVLPDPHDEREVDTQWIRDKIMEYTKDVRMPRVR